MIAKKSIGYPSATSAARSCSFALRRTLGVALVAGSVLSLTDAAIAQTALGDGRALDRNLHANDGRYNPSKPGVSDQIRLNNAIITGTATDGRSFRGYVGYGTTTDFRGSSPSNDLYQFRRDSATSGVFGSGVRGTDALRYQFALTTGQAPPRSLSTIGISGAGTGSLDRASTGTSSGNASALRSTSEFLAGQSNRPSIIGGRTDDRGYEWTVKSSPLTGINWVRSDGQVVRPDREQNKLAEVDLGQKLRPEADKLPRPSTSDQPRSVPGLSGLESAIPGVDNAIDRNSNTRLGNPGGLSTRVDSSRIDPSTGLVHARILQSLRDASAEGAGKPGTGLPAGTGTNDPGQAAARGSDIESQLQSLRQQLRGEPSRSASPASASRLPAASSPRQPIAADRQPGTASGTSSGAGITDTRRPSGASTTNSNLLSPEFVKALKNVGSIKTETLAKPAAEPIAPKPDEAAYQVHMRSGQDLLTQGRFFDAEDRFTRALAARPGEPMAGVGRIHSQLSAGLYLSAAANLRNLFIDYPELIGASYGENLIPSLTRAEKIVDQLRVEMARNNSGLGKDAATLLAYLGHLRQNPQWVNEGLLELTKRSDLSVPNEAAFVEALRAAWTN